MSQTDYSIADQTGVSFLADLSTTLGAIVSNNSGATQPATTFAYMWWMDTNANILKQRNPGNTAWISKLKIYNSYVNVDNTSDANKPVSSAAQAALNLKANNSTTYTETEVNNLLDAKADAATTPSYQTETVTLGNLFGTQTVEVTRIGNVVTIASKSVLTHSFDSGPTSDENILPTWAVPNNAVVDNCYYLSGPAQGEIIMAAFSLDFNNRLRTSYFKTDGTTLQASQSFSAPILSYIV